MTPVPLPLAAIGGSGPETLTFVITGTPQERSLVAQTEEGSGAAHWAWEEYSEALPYRQVRAAIAAITMSAPPVPESVVHQWLKDSSAALRESSAGIVAMALRGPVELAPSAYLQVLSREGGLVQEGSEVTPSLARALAVARTASEPSRWEEAPSSAFRSPRLAQTSLGHAFLRECDGIAKRNPQAQASTNFNSFARLVALALNECIVDPSVDPLEEILYLEPVLNPEVLAVGCVLWWRLSALGLSVAGVAAKWGELRDGHRRSRRLDTSQKAEWYPLGLDIYCAAVERLVKIAAGR